MQYRKELDGLRALAVLAVIIYHANIKFSGITLFQGGFLGVDIFFVLSGYLITGILKNKIETEQFSIFNFYWRRTKRIVPALFTMLIVTSIVAYFVLLPSDLNKYSQSLKSAIFFGSNYHFYNEDSYMAQASIYKPLLHTWSLSVEWQFYIIYPVAFWLIAKFFRKYLFGILIIFSLLSLQYSDFIVPNQPESAFYLLPTRAWEFILGGLVTFFNREHLKNPRTDSIENFIFKILPILGLFLITHSLFFLDHNIQHPSFITLVPVLGTCLFIMFTHEGDISYTMLSKKPIVFIGLISYSLYLWHQPVFVFFRMLKHDNIRFEQFILLTFISFILALLTYKLVEFPLRKIKSTLKLISALVLVTITLYKTSDIYSNGLPTRFSELSELFSEDNALIANKINNLTCQNARFPNICQTISNKNGTVILIGDSNAGAISLSVKNHSIDNGYNYIQISSSGCETLPLNTINEYEKSKYSEHQWKTIELCVYNSNHVFDLIKKHPEADVIYHITRIGTYSEKIANRLGEIAKKVKSLNIIYPIPLGENNIKINLFKLRNSDSILKSLNDKMTFSSNYTDATRYKNGAYETYNNVFGENIRRFYMEPYFCDKSNCYTHDSKNIYYVDERHLSIYGAEKALSDIMPKILTR
ncbi:acyltransferase [Vibrio sp. LQ2]|uniref:acyltransferase family protein n=1 Tax=Vibrio TaxID=662 RepID=UPI00208EE3C6|nr:acyltransferase family protein [Vibrio sp. LQ2]USP04275.1 acyltransferase [Vibrio sp. LQ2]